MTIDARTGLPFTVAQREADLAQWQQAVETRAKRIEVLRSMRGKTTILSERTIIMRLNEETSAYEFAKSQVERIKAAIKAEQGTPLTSEHVAWWRGTLRDEGGEG